MTKARNKMPPIEAPKTNSKRMLSTISFPCEMSLRERVQELADRSGRTLAGQARWILLGALGMRPEGEGEGDGTTGTNGTTGTI